MSMRDEIIYGCPHANCRTPIDTGKCSKACIERYNKEMGKKPMTNADRIRAMSDKELAEFAAEKIVNLENRKMVEQGHTPTATQLSALGHTSYCVLMRWIQQPAEE